MTTKVVEILKDQEEVSETRNKQGFAYFRKQRIINIVRSRIKGPVLRCAVDHNKLNISKDIDGFVSKYVSKNE